METPEKFLIFRKRNFPISQEMKSLKNLYFRKSLLLKSFFYFSKWNFLAPSLKISYISEGNLQSPKNIYIVRILNFFIVIIVSFKVNMLINTRWPNAAVAERIMHAIYSTWNYSKMSSNSVSGTIKAIENISRNGKKFLHKKVEINNKPV